MSRIHDSQILVYFEPQNDKFLSSGIGHMNEKLCRNKVSNTYQYSKLISNVRMRLSVSTLEKWNVERVTVYFNTLLAIPAVPAKRQVRQLELS